MTPLMARNSAGAAGVTAMDKPLPGKQLPSDVSEDPAEIARREALKRLGIFAAYTAPTMMVLLSTKIASAQFIESGSTD